jgi:DNA helicase II / ATP-dependent DNA helicase PcrA
LVQLSRPQEEAVKYVEGAAVVTAGAGSGKTRVLTSKIAHLVNDLDYDPARILAITFTNKAADEMKSRLRKITRRPATAFPWVRTFHSACFQILKRYGAKFGFQSPIVIHSDYQQTKDLKKVFIELGVDEKKYLKQMASMISLAKNSKDPMVFLDGRKLLPDKRFEIYKRYNEILRGQNAVDFDDILMLTRDLLRDYPTISDRYRDYFQYILVDEFQDSNEVQNEITHMLTNNGNLTVVGDDYQSIYMFRGANPAHFISFAKGSDDVRVFKLEKNYRSTKQIVLAANAVIARNIYKLEKECFSSREGSLIGLSEFFNDQLEAAWVASKCLEYKKSHGIEYRDITVLYRAKFCSFYFERALRNSRIPYKMLGGVGFFQRREIQDLNAYLISAVNTRDNASFERIVNVPSRRIGEGTVKRIVRNTDAESTQESCREALTKNFLSATIITNLRAVLSVLEHIKNLPPVTAINEVMRLVDYKDYMKGFCENEIEYESRLENIEQLLFSAQQFSTIADYLEDVSLVNEDKADEEKDDGVRLSTIHAAKGLEYKVVFIVAAEERILPHARAIEESSDGIEEERRLMYVAMTRAADQLHITHSEERRGTPMFPSSFISEIPAHFLEELTSRRPKRSEIDW